MPEYDAYSLIKVCFSDLNEAENIINHNPEIIDAKTGLGETAFHYLVVENQLDAVNFLFNKGSDINSVNEFGDTPIAQAAVLGYVEMVRWLIENGADLNTIDKARDPLMHNAVRSGNAEIIQLLISNGVSIHDKNNLGESALHESVKDVEYFDVTKFLVENGAFIDELSAFNDTPLFRTIIHDNPKAAQYLVGLGASLSLKDSKGRTPLDLALECGNAEIENLLKAKQ